MRSRITLEAAALGAVVGALVVAPWAGHGYLLLLDWVSGPHQTLSTAVHGLGGRGLDALPFRYATQALRAVAGPRVTAWLLIWAFFPLGAAGMARLVGGGRWRTHSAALFFVVNPFVADRVRAGHVALLLSVAMIAWLAHAAVEARRCGKWFSARTAGWFAVAVSTSPHAAWLGSVVLLAVAVLPRPGLRDVVRTAAAGACAAAVYAYGIVLVLGDLPQLAVTAADLDVYATRAGPGGPLVTALSLHGFWRDGGPLARDVLPLPVGAVLLLAVLAAVAFGLVRTCRADPALGAPVVAVTITGVLLGAGVPGPAGGLYRWLFDTLPLFEVMREQEKWVALAALGYAVGVGVAVEALAQRRPVGVLVAVAGPAVVAPTLLWGLGDTVGTSAYPASWAAADRLMGTGQEAVLFLPWHGYQPFGFTGGRSVATPAAAYFRHPVIDADTIELGELRSDSTAARSAYLDRIVAHGGGTGFGRDLVSLGVSYVVLAHGPDADAYRWLAAQPSLRLVSHAPDLDVYRVTAPGQARAVHRVNATTWRIDPGPAGRVVIPEEWSPGWRLDGRPGTATATGTVAFQVGPAAATAVYEPARWVAAGTAISALVLLALVGVGLYEHRDALRRRRARGQASAR